MSSSLTIVSYSGKFDTYYSNKDPSFKIEYGISNEFLSPGRTKGEFAVVTDDRYWMNRFSRPRSSDAECKLRLLFKETLLKEWMVICSYSFRFQRILWSQARLFDAFNDVPIKYSYIEKDSIEFYLDI